MAHVIEVTQRPALILAPNKTLAAQLYGEFRSFFPENAVEYFVSYYDYYQPEAYVPRTDTYIEKEARSTSRSTGCATPPPARCWSVTTSWSSRPCRASTASATRDLLGHDLPADQGRTHRPAPAAGRPRGAAIQAQRQAFQRGTFRVRGDTVEVFPSHLDDRAWRCRCSATSSRRSSSSTRSPATSPPSSKASRSTPTRTTSRPSRPSTRP
jgi:excinuclease ABC subunit B